MLNFCPFMLLYWVRFNKQYQEYKYIKGLGDGKNYGNDYGEKNVKNVKDHNQSINQLIACSLGIVAPRSSTIVDIGP